MNKSIQSPQIKIIRAEVMHLSILKTISVQTFTDSFASANTKEDMDLYLNNTFNTDVLEKELNDPETHYYLTLVDDKPAGYLKLNLGKNQKESLETAVEI